jgi:hypothetical protein
MMNNKTVSGHVSDAKPNPKLSESVKETLKTPFIEALKDQVKEVKHTRLPDGWNKKL